MSCSQSRMVAIHSWMTENINVLVVFFPAQKNFWQPKYSPFVKGFTNSSIIGINVCQTITNAMRMHISL